MRFKSILFIIFLCPMLSCNFQEAKSSGNGSLNRPVVEDKVSLNKELIIKHELKIKETLDFNFPVGKPNAKDYYNAQSFGKNNYLGDDWNGTGGGNTDLGDNVFTIGNGVVVFAEDLGGGWGNVVRILHRQDGVIYESIYAHLGQMEVAEDQVISKGDKIGTIGTANGSYLAHLHLEVRNKVNMDIVPGYSEDTTGYLDPTLFIKTH